MAPTKTNKVHKLSYAERVLSALSQVQKEHRRHSVHMATLRAQVKKNAEAKKDPLGPQWSHWVTKAVHKLAEEGVVGTNDQHVFLTTEGRNTISAAKRSVRYVADSDERIIRRATSIAASPQKRRSIGGPGDDGTFISAAPTRKRARMSSISTRSTRNATARATAATDTVAESATPVRRGRGRPRKSITFASPMERDLSPLTDITELDHEYAEENARLRDVLRGKEDVISGLRRRLDEVEAISGRHAAPPTDDEDREADGDEEETPLGDLPPTEQLTPAPSLTKAKHLVAKGLTRTQSGSIIPDISKQPTPAPSDGEETELEEDEPGIGRVWSSPEATPTDDVRVGQDQLEAAKSLLSNQVRSAERELEKAEEAFSDRIQGLERDIAERSGRIEELNRELEMVKEKEALARSEGANHAIVVQDMQTRLKELQKEKEAVVQELCVERKKSLALTEQLELATNENQDVRRELKQSTERVASLGAKAELNAVTISELERTLSESRDQLKVADERCAELESSSYGKDEELGLLQAQLQALNDELEKLKNQAVEQELALGEAVAKLGEDDVRRGRLEEELVTRERQLDQVRQELGASQSELESWRAEAGRKEKRIQDLSTEIAGTKENFANVEHSLVVEETRHQKEQQRFKERITLLENLVGIVKAELNESKRKVTEVELEREELRALNVGLKADVLSLQMELDGEKKQSGFLEIDLANQVAKTQSLEEDLRTARAAKEAAEIDAVGVQTSFEKFRQSQMKGLEELGKEINSRLPLPANTMPTVADAES